MVSLDQAHGPCSNVRYLIQNVWKLTTACMAESVQRYASNLVSQKVS